MGWVSSLVLIMLSKTIVRLLWSFLMVTDKIVRISCEQDAGTLNAWHGDSVVEGLLSFTWERDEHSCEWNDNEHLWMRLWRSLLWLIRWWLCMRMRWWGSYMWMWWKWSLTFDSEDCHCCSCLQKFVQKICTKFLQNFKNNFVHNFLKISVQNFWGF